MSVYLKRQNGSFLFCAGGLSGGSAASMYDGGLSTISDNAVQNKVITVAVNGLRSDIGNIQNDILSINSALSDVDLVPTEDSTKFVQSGGVYSAVENVDNKLKNTVTSLDKALPESEILDLISDVNKLKPVGKTNDPSTIVWDRTHSVYAYASDDVSTALTNFPDNSLRGYTILALAPGDGSSDPVLIALNNGKAWLLTSRTPWTWDSIVVNSDLTNFLRDINKTAISTVTAATKLTGEITRDANNEHQMNVPETTVGDVEHYIKGNYDTEATEDSDQALTSGAIYDIQQDLQTQIDALEGARIFKGSIAFANLPSLANTEAGWVYNITDDFTTTADFIDGAGKEVEAGTDIAVVNTGTHENPILKWDVMAETSHLQPKNLSTSLQIGTLPRVTTVEDALGKVADIVPTTASDENMLLTAEDAYGFKNYDLAGNIALADYGNKNEAFTVYSNATDAPRTGTTRWWEGFTLAARKLASRAAQFVTSPSVFNWYSRTSSGVAEPEDVPEWGPWVRMTNQQEFTFRKEASSTSEWAVFQWTAGASTSGALPVQLTIGGNGYYNSYIINRFIAYEEKDRAPWIDQIVVSEAGIDPGFIALHVSGSNAFNGACVFTHQGYNPYPLTFLGMKTTAEVNTLNGTSSLTNILARLATVPTPAEVVSGSYTFASSSSARWRTNKTFTLGPGIWEISCWAYSNYTKQGRCGFAVSPLNSSGYSQPCVAALLDPGGGCYGPYTTGTFILTASSNTIYCKSDSESYDYVNNASGITITYRCTKIANI